MSSYPFDICPLNQNKKENTKKEEIKKRTTKRKLPVKDTKVEQNNNTKRLRENEDIKEGMMSVYQPWVIQTYGDQAKTKTITLKKYARILRTLRGEELSNADNSKFRFWVKAKGFCIGRPHGYEVKPADTIIGRYSVCDSDEGIAAVVGEQLKGSAKDPPLYVPNVGVKNSGGDSAYRKVAVVENFFDIIYNVHVNLEGKAGKHAGQKRTYRTITETYAFLPREAVTRFLLSCTECQKRPRSTSPTPSPSPTSHDSLPSQTTSNQITVPIITNNSIETSENQLNQDEKISKTSTECSKSIKTAPKKSSSILSPCINKNKIRKKNPLSLWSPVKCIEEEQNQIKSKNNVFSPSTIDYTMPITTTYLKYMRSLGCKEEEALNFENKHHHLCMGSLIAKYTHSGATDSFTLMPHPVSIGYTGIPEVVF